MKGKRKYSKLKKIFLVILLSGIAFWSYVEIVNRNSKNMTIRQKFLKAVYPVFTGYNRLFGKATKVLTNEKNIQPQKSFYDLSVRLNNGTELNFGQLKGKKVLLVNTASDCGFTGQYDELEKLYEENKDKLMIIGFPANDFKHQENGTDEEIAAFCKVNFGVTFPLAKKTVVIKADQQNEIFKWLSDKTKNGWNNKQPSWNFSKYLVNENGILVNYFDPSISPLSEKVITAIKTN